jgi:hypothetical protein
MGLLIIIAILILFPALTLTLLLSGFRWRKKQAKWNAKNSFWYEFSQCFGTSEPRPDEAFQFQKLGFGRPLLGTKTARLSYGQALWITVNNEWIDIRMGNLGRIFGSIDSHPPLRIPLDQIEGFHPEHTIVGPAIVVTIRGRALQFFDKSGAALTSVLTSQARHKEPPPLPSEDSRT